MKRHLLLVVLLVMTVAHAVHAQAWIQKYPMFYTRVNAIAQHDNTLYVGGDFDYTGLNEGKFVALDSATGSVNTSFPKMYFYSKLIPDGNGGMYVLGAGNVQIGGQFRNRLAHVYANGVLSSWNPNPNGNINDVKLSGDKVYVAGRFDTIGGQRRRYIAALDTSTGGATAWNPDIDQQITTLAVTNNTVYVAGPFTFIAGQVRGVLAAFSATTGAITSWDPSGGTIFTSSNPSVAKLEASGNTIYVGGTFTSIGGQSRNRMAAINASTGAVTNWNPSPTGNAFAYNDLNWTVRGNLIYATGGFSNIGGQLRNGIAAIDSATGLATAWNPASNQTFTNEQASDFSISGTTMYVAIGYLPTSDKYIYTINTITGSYTPWSPTFKWVGYPPTGGAVTVAVIGGKVFASGNFYGVNGHTAKNLVALDATTGNELTWNPNINGTVSKLVVAGNKLYIVGNFDSIGGQSRKKLACYNLSTGTVTPWNPNPNNTVTDLAVSGGAVYLSGAFTSVGGLVRNYLAVVDTATGAAISWAPVVNTPNNVLFTNANKLYVGGDFTFIGGQSRNRLASFDLSTGTLTSWNPAPNAPIIGFAKNDNSLFILGSYSSISSQTRNRLTAFDLTTDTLKPFSSNIPLPTGSFYGLIANSSKVFVFGGTVNSTGIGPASPAYFVSVDARSGQTIPWNYSISGGYPNSGLAGTTGCGVYTTLISGNTIYLGGMFTNIGNYSSASFAAFGDTTTPPLPPVRFISFQGQRLANDTIKLTWQTADENYISGYQVQKSLDSTSFTSIGTVGLNASHNYQFLHISADSVAYYRILAIPTNNIIRYSSVIKMVRPVLPPVRFTSFQGQRQTNGTVQLNWQTADENFVSGYEVQRSTDSLTFTARGTVAVNTAHSYQFTDQTTDTLNYYRIRAIPTNSNTRYSGVLKLSLQQPTQTINRLIGNVFPNPSTNNVLQLHVDSLAQGSYNISIYSLASYRVVQRNINHPGGVVNVAVNVTSVIGGTYIVTLTDPNRNVIVRQRWIRL